MPEQPTKNDRAALRLTVDDKRCLVWFKHRYGIKTDSQVIRVALSLWKCGIDQGLINDQHSSFTEIISRKHSGYDTTSLRKGWHTYLPPD